MRLLYKDPWLFAVEKPAGLPTLSAPRGQPMTLSSEIAKQFPEQSAIKDCGIVHRLDNDTSGIVIVARSQKIYDRLREIWNTEAVQKIYHAWVIGDLEGSGEIDTPIAHHLRKKKKMGEHAEGRPAITKWNCIRSQAPREETSREARHLMQTLLEISITTGVRPQIRVHLASIGHPIVGDSLYQRGEKMGDSLQLRLVQITLPHPQTKATLQLQSKSL